MDIIPHAQAFIYSNPPYKVREFFQDHSWTTSISGYLVEAYDLSKRIIVNSKYTPYSHIATIRFMHDHDVREVKESWAYAMKQIGRKSLPLLWVRELSERSRVHYHIILSAPKHSSATIYDILKRATKDYNTNISVQPYKPRLLYPLAYYVTKAKVAGYVDGKLCKDKYKDKRRLFLPNLDLRKYGATKGFFDKRTDEDIRAYKDVSKAIREGGVPLEVEEEANEIYAMLGDYMPYNRILFTLMYFYKR